MDPNENVNTQPDSKEDASPDADMLTPLELQSLMRDFYESALELGLPNAEDFLDPGE